MNIIEEKPSVVVNNTIKEYISLFPELSLEQSLEYFKTKEIFEILTEQWYEKFYKEGLESAYRVYDDDYYFIDLLQCFKTYSRRYLRDMKNRPLMKDSVDKRSFIEHTENSKIILDIGCGLGLTTASLKQLYPNAIVYGLNLKDTKQWKFCECMSEKYNFELVESIEEIEDEVDVVFASEYFEHIINPLEHVNDIISKTSPKYIVTANAFNTRSIGHIPIYTNGDDEIDEKYMSNMFNSFLKRSGYINLKTNMWNNKPNIWKKNRDLNEVF